MYRIFRKDLTGEEEGVGMESEWKWNCDVKDRADLKKGSSRESEVRKCTDKGDGPMRKV